MKRSTLLSPPPPILQVLISLSALLLSPHLLPLFPALLPTLSLLISSIFFLFIFTSTSVFFSPPFCSCLLSSFLLSLSDLTYSTIFSLCLCCIFFCFSFSFSPAVFLFFPRFLMLSLFPVSPFT